MPGKQQSAGGTIIDSNLTFPEAIAGTSAPAEVIRDLTLLTVHYYALDGKLHRGQLMAHRRLREELEALFGMIRETRFPLARVIPIVRYRWSDEASMEDNNSSAFNYRVIAGTSKLSQHAYGSAIDLNPRQNPVVYADGTMLPHGALYDVRQEGTFTAESGVVKEFISRGWQWGGLFKDVKDYHHFEKPLRDCTPVGVP